MPEFDLLSEGPFPLAEAGRRVSWLRTRERAPSFYALLRWAKDGRLTRDGRRVRLETRRLGRSLVTSEPALRRFIEALSAGDCFVPTAVKAEPCDARAEAAERRLAACGA